MNDLKIKVLEINDYKLLHIQSDPPRLEAKIVLGRDDISQKLLYTLMEITHQHGFSCSPPLFGQPSSSQMTFLVGTVLPNKRSAKSYAAKISDCLDDLSEFFQILQKQMDFSVLDVSMMGGIDFDEMDFSYLAALRDQNFDGSWNKFKDALIERGQRTEVVDKCALFEKENKKDLGLVGHKLRTTLQSLEGQFIVEDNIN